MKQEEKKLKALKLWLVILAALGFVVFQPYMGALLLNDNNFSETKAMIFMVLGSLLRFAAIILFIVYLTQKRKNEKNANRKCIELTKKEVKKIEKRYSIYLFLFIGSIIVIPVFSALQELHGGFFGFLSVLLLGASFLSCVSTKRKLKNIEVVAYKPSEHIVKTQEVYERRKKMETVRNDKASREYNPELFGKDKAFRTLDNDDKNKPVSNDYKSAANSSLELSEYIKKQKQVIKMCSVLKKYLLQNNFNVIHVYKKDDNYYEHKLYMIKQADGFKFILNTKNKDNALSGAQTREKEIEADYCDHHSLSEFINYMNLHLMIWWFDEIGSVLYSLMSGTEK